MTPIERTRISLAVVAQAARNLRRDGHEGGGAWRGVLRQVRRYADELRWRQRTAEAAR